MVQRKENWARALTDAISLATNVAAVVAIGIFGGQWLDHKFGTHNTITILGFALGVASALKILWDKLMEKERNNKTVDKTDQGEQ